MSDDTKQIKIMTVDDHPVLRQGIAALKPVMRRLFSTFSSGPPALGLLLLRVVAGAALIVNCVRLYDGESPQAITPHLIAAGAGLLHLAGLWTPVAGTIVAVIELLIALSTVMIHG